MECGDVGGMRWRCWGQQQEVDGVEGRNARVWKAGVPGCGGQVCQGVEGRCVWVWRAGVPECGGQVCQGLEGRCARVWRAGCAGGDWAEGGQ